MSYFSRLLLKIKSILFFALSLAISPTLFAQQDAEEAPAIEEWVTASMCAEGDQSIVIL